MIGKLISHYRVLEELGRGGMGVVYRAEDTRLKRSVALKFLPPALITDPEAKQRFVHEAQAASALDHPNICTVHDVVDVPNGQTFIVMACYEGETLKEKMERGPLPVNDALDIVVQVALGLSKAHQHEIVHRDIKPANIMVTAQGEVKILDFGLAKLSGISMMTRAGGTVGTVAYMSPEQARGEKVDQRTDLWSLGVVLFEMLTGELPFKSDYEQALVYGIMNVDPKGVREIRKDLPENVELIIRRLLAKEPADRYASADDLLADLLAVRESSSARVSAGTLPHRTSARRKRNFVFISAVAALLLAAAAAIIYLLPKGTAVHINPKYTTRVLRTQQFKTQAFPGPVPINCMAGISSDGNWVTYGAPNDSGSWDIYFTHISWTQPRKVSEREHLGYGSVGISPGGDMIAVRAGGTDSPLLLLSTAGGEKRIVEGSVSFVGQWSPDGERISYCMKPAGHPWEIWTTSKDGINKRIVFVDSLAYRVQAVCWSPDGKSMAWARNIRGITEIFTRELASGRERQLTFDNGLADEPVWLSTGTILFTSIRSGKMGQWAISEEGGEPQAVSFGSTELTSLRASRDGKRIITSEFDALTDVEMSDIDGSQARKMGLNRFVSSEWTSFASDLSSYAYFYLDPSEGVVLYVSDAGGNDTRRLARFSGSVYFGNYFGTAWSPDNKWIAYVEGEGRGLSIIEVGNPGNARRICNAPRRWAWIDSTNLVVQTRGESVEYSIHQSDPMRIWEDSTFGKPILGGRYRLYIDLRDTSNTPWPQWHLVPLDRQGRVRGQPKEILPGTFVNFSSDGSVCLFLRGRSVEDENEFWKPPCELWKMTLPDLGMERVQSGYSNNLYFAMISNGGKKIAHLAHNTTMKLTLIENLFE